MPFGGKLAGSLGQQLRLLRGDAQNQVVIDRVGGGIDLGGASGSRFFGDAYIGVNCLYFTHLKSVRLHLCNLKITKVG